MRLTALAGLAHTYVGKDEGDVAALESIQCRGEVSYNPTTGIRAYSAAKLPGREVFASDIRIGQFFTATVPVQIGGSQKFTSRIVRVEKILHSTFLAEWFAMVTLLHDSGKSVGLNLHVLTDIVLGASNSVQIPLSDISLHVHVVRYGDSEHFFVLNAHLVK